LFSRAIQPNQIGVAIPHDIPHPRAKIHFLPVLLGSALPLEQNPQTAHNRLISRPQTLEVPCLAHPFILPVVDGLAPSLCNLSLPKSFRLLLALGLRRLAGAAGVGVGGSCSGWRPRIASISYCSRNSRVLRSCRKPSSISSFASSACRAK
jgi:hypothetical protein